ncbi:hypothetical protein [Sphaerisporangium sp. TRM90804]|uniref:hypothetical protein n=1 Tax=Sphaerisporangium sp. TRM90804 TaxID=3031113 RepID=UPI002449CB0F|nr:hypothetical protein [Sphaerisporangium sp. TRM90804]MDH2428936.1 hypothetical protein [Sphaerisporangium sp. TRM90804]
MRPRLMVSVLVVAGLSTMGAARAPSEQPTPPASAATPSAMPVSSWRQAFTFADQRVDESSGLVASRAHPGAVWTVNDGQGPVRLFAVDSGGRTRAVVTLDGVEGVDPEALGGAVGQDGKSYLYVGDIGGNPVPRPDGVVVYRLAEPATLADARVKATAYRLTYPDGQHDAESLLVNPRSGQLFVMTKTAKGGALYRAPARLSESRPNMLTLVRDSPYVISDGLILPDGRLLLRGYNKARVWKDLDAAAPELTLDLPQQRQGEGVAVTADGRGLLISSEGALSPVWRMDLPATRDEVREERPAVTAVAETDSFPTTGMLWGVGGGLALTLLAAGLVVAVRAEGRT